MIRLKSLTITYGKDRAALNGVSVAFLPGRFTVLLGPSGAGKSSLLRSLNGLVVPASGDIVVDGLGSILAGPARMKAHRQRTAMVFQQHHLVSRLSAFRNVLTGRLAFASRLHAILPLPRADRLMALAALERVGLLEQALQRAETLSGGQQQRVGIARALVQRPELLLADEPVASLDPAAADAVLALIRTVAMEDGITAIVSLHQVELARRFADWVVGLNAGRIVFEGPPSGLDAAALAKIYAGASEGSPPEPIASAGPDPARTSAA